MQYRNFWKESNTQARYVSAGYFSSDRIQIFKAKVLSNLSHLLWNQDNGAQLIKAPHESDYRAMGVLVRKTYFPSVALEGVSIMAVAVPSCLPVDFPPYCYTSEVACYETILLLTDQLSETNVVHRQRIRMGYAMLIIDVKEITLVTMKLHLMRFCPFINAGPRKTRKVAQTTSVGERRENALLSRFGDRTA